MPKLVHPGTLSLYTAGVLPRVRPCVPTRGLICAFDPDFLIDLPKEIFNDSNTRSVADGVLSQDKRCFLDVPLQHTLEALRQEAETGGSFGSRYAHQLIQSLRRRLVELTHASYTSRWLKNRMDLSVVRRMSTRLEVMPGAGLDLDTLAAESGCSKRHLLRCFRTTTGRSPHQYVLDLRLEKARRLMLKPLLNLIDIASECGFASQAHLTYAFRQRLGLPPSEFRRRL